MRKLMVALLSLALLPTLAVAQAYPARPVTLVVPYPPGGTTDIVARLVAPKIGELIGQSIVIENRAGAGGTITIRSGSQTGTVLGTVAVPNTGGWETFQNVQTTITPGSGPLFLSFSGGSGSLFDVDTLTLSTS